MTNSPEDMKVPEKPYEKKCASFKKALRRQQEQARTKNKEAVVQFTLSGDEISVKEAERAHAAHLRYMAYMARDRSL